MEATRFEFSETRAVLGDNHLQVDGWLDTRSLIPDGEVTVRAAGPDISVVGPFAGIDGLPEDAFNIDGRIRKTGNNWQFDESSRSGKPDHGIYGDQRIRIDDFGVRLDR